MHKISKYINITNNIIEFSSYDELREYNHSFLDKIIALDLNLKENTNRLHVVITYWAVHDKYGVAISKSIKFFNKGQNAEINILILFPTNELVKWGCDTMPKNIDIPSERYFHFFPVIVSNFKSLNEFYEECLNIAYSQILDNKKYLKNS